MAKRERIGEYPVASTRATAISKGATPVESDPDQMSERRKQFCEHYLVHRNARAAALHVDYTEKSAHNQGHLMLRNPHVAAYLAKRQKEVTEQAEISTHEWAMHLKAVTFSKVGDIFDNEGRMIPLHELAPQVQASISSFEARRGENGTMTYSVKFWPKPAGLDIMARHLGLFKADNDQRPKDETPLKIEYIGD